MTMPHDGPNFSGAPPSPERDNQPMEAYAAAWDRLDIALDEGDEVAFYEALDLLGEVAAIRPTCEEDYDVYFGARRTLALERIWGRRVRRQEVGVNDIRDAQNKLGDILNDHAVDARGRDPDQHGLMVTLAMAITMRGHDGLALTNSPRRQRGTDEFGVELPSGDYIRVDSLLELDEADYTQDAIGICVCLGQLIESAIAGNLLPHELRRAVNTSGRHWASYVEHVRRALVQEANYGELPARYDPIIDKAVQKMFKLIKRCADRAQSPPLRSAQKRR